MFAERARTPVVLAAVAASVAFAITALFARTCPDRRPAIIVTSIPPATSDAIEISDFCPPHVRAAIHVGEDATLYCVRGLYPEPGTFVFARYQTTEAWERFAVVADDGQLIVPMLDRPSARR